MSEKYVKSTHQIIDYQISIYKTATTRMLNTVVDVNNLFSVNYSLLIYFQFIILFIKYQFVD